MESPDNIDTTGTLTKHFEFQQRESELYRMWEEAGIFKPENAAPDAPVFNIAMPPPNANGELHLGHSFGYTVMDILGRFHRLRGKRVLLLPGKDHAGIQTQVVYERKLKAEGTDITALDPEQLYRMCYDFCIDRAQYMRSQEKRLALSADWSRELFTLDPRLSQIVFDTFERMWRDGLVYRGKRIINWSVFSQTAISDAEVDYVEAAGNLWYIRYPFAGKISAPVFPTAQIAGSYLLHSGASDSKLLILAGRADAPAAGTVLELPEGDSAKRYIVYSSNAGEWTGSELQEKFGAELTRKERESIGLGESRIALTAAVLLPHFEIESGLITATTRPETMLGDSALAVHPDDPRYRALIGSPVKLPLTAREIPIIADSRIDMNFGTGVVKVTPAHDFLDYEIGCDHRLEVRQVIGKDGSMTAEAGSEFAGLPAAECRKRAVAALESQGLLLDTRSIKHKVPIGERGKDVIEPLISEQWFIAVDAPGKSLKRRALELVRSGRIKIHPERFQVLFEQWLENLRDWNVSRQLWWGHRMPVWYREENGTVCETVVSQQRPQGAGWRQESDTFDTWFSSGQWAYSTFAAHGLVNLDEDRSGNKFVPSHTMVMGRDILFFWACRMLLLTAYRLDDVPWRNIFFTGLIRDEQGQKMSKSKGNGIEPNEMISKFGTDSLRLGLVMGASPGNDLNLSERKIEGYSKFINKLWNAAKLLELKSSAAPDTEWRRTPKVVNLDSSAWILKQLKRVQEIATEKLEGYEISIAADEIYNLTWTVYCDWSLEMLKALADSADAAMRQEALQISRFAFGRILTMLHPFLPYVTEEIWQQHPLYRGSGLLAASAWDENWPELGASADARRIDTVVELVTAVRSVKAALGVPHKRINTATALPLNSEGAALFSALAKADLVNPSVISGERALRKSISGGSVVCDVEGKEQYRQRLQKDLEQNQAVAAQLQKKLSGAFAAQAKPELVQKERERLQSAERAAEEILRELEGMA